MIVNKTDFNWKMVGQAGEGVIVASQIMAKIIKRHGWKVFNYLEYPSLIKGGNQSGQVFASLKSAYSSHQLVQFMVALNPSSLIPHLCQLDQTSIVILNCDDNYQAENLHLNTSAKIIALPLSKITQAATGHNQYLNTTIIGATTLVLGLDKEIAETVLSQEFTPKGQETVNKNLQAFEAGWQAIQTYLAPTPPRFKQADNRCLLSGAQAVGLGALSAGLQFYSAYPMTPSTSLMHFLAEKQNQHPLIVKHAEDEIGAINHAIGASFAGVRAMTGSSGGGFSLMVESLSFAGVAEIPLVVLEGQRKGPATGLPTWTEQADLQFVINAGHGDFPKVVLAPGTVKEHFEITRLAFQIAEKYQLPVIILSDKYILESHQDCQLTSKYANSRSSLIDQPPDNYQRYQLNSTGISHRTLPGTLNGEHLANSYEHDQKGFSTEQAEMTVQQTQKRMQKLKTLKLQLPKINLYGPKRAELTLVCWGSTINPLLDLLNLDYYQLQTSINVIHLQTLWPFPSQEFIEIVKGQKKLVIIEGNATNQCAKLISQETGLSFFYSITRYDGRPFYSEELASQINQINI